jgi:hypothetical protein
MNRGPSGNPRCMGPHGAAWGRMGLHGAAWCRMVRPNPNPEREKKGARRRLLFAARWRWDNNPLALPSKYPIPERDRAPLGERHKAFARR